MKKQTKTFILVLVLFLFSLSVRLVDVTATGELSDERQYSYSGFTYITAILHGDVSRETWSQNYEHPPVAKWLYGVCTACDPFPETRDYDHTLCRTTSALLGALTVVTVFFIGRRLKNQRAGVTAALVLALTPHVVGHNKIVGLETPSLFFYTLAVAFLVAYLTGRNATRQRISFVAMAACAGLAVGTRFTNLDLYVVLALSLYVWRDHAVRRTVRGGIFGQVLALSLISLAVFFLLWPWLWSDPLGSLAKTLTFHLGRESGNNAGYFLGGPVETPAPRSFYIVYLYAMTPPLVLGLVLFGLATELPKQGKTGIIAVWFFSTMLWALTPVRWYNIRYIIHVYPAMALISSFGLENLVSLLKERLSVAGRHPSAVHLLFSFLLVTSLAYACWSVHPYYIDYYNVLVGGPQAAYHQNLFDFGWWGEGSHEALSYLATHGEPHSSIDVRLPQIHSVHPRILSAYADKDMSMCQAKANGRFPLFHGQNLTLEDDVYAYYLVIHVSQERYFNESADPRVYVSYHNVTVDGAPIVRIYRMRDSLARIYRLQQVSETGSH